MKVVLLPSLYYETVVEQSDGVSTSKFFTSKNSIRSRELALSHFLEIALSDEALGRNPHFVSVYCRHLTSGRRIEIMNSAIYQDAVDSLNNLEEELLLYKKEGAKVETAIWSYKQPNLITLVRPHEERPKGQGWEYSNEFLSHNYWLFIKAREQRYLSA
jgi:hypothetical protein